MLGRRLHSGTFKTKESRAGLVRVPLYEVPLGYLRPRIIYAAQCDLVLGNYFVKKHFSLTIIYIYILTWQGLPISTRSADAGAVIKLIKCNQSNTVFCMVLLQIGRASCRERV